MSDVIKDRTEAVDPDDCGMPDSVRTPGRTWTEIDIPDTERGDGSLTVEAPDAVTVLPIQDAYNRFPDVVEQVFFGHTAPDDNRLAALHAAHLEDATFIHIPEHAAVEEPIRVTGSGEHGFFPQHVVVYAAPGSTASIVEAVTGDADCHTAFADVLVGDDASVTYTVVNQHGDTLGYGERHAVVQENGTMRWQTATTGTTLYKDNTVTRLAAPRSELQHALGFLGAGEQHLDHTVHVIHDADNTRCNIDARGVALDSARTVYKGVQEVNQDAEGTRSFQDESTVTVGESCEADTTPQLRIDNNDVEATHAATTGHVDDEDLFYMKSRGLREVDAVREIITGMFDDLIDEAGDTTATDALHHKIAGTLGT